MSDFPTVPDPYEGMDPVTNMTPGESSQAAGATRTILEQFAHNIGAFTQQGLSGFMDIPGKDLAEMPSWVEQAKQTEGLDIKNPEDREKLINFAMGIVGPATVKGVGTPAQGFTRLYRGESAKGPLPSVEGGPWWTNDLDYASRYGEVKYLDLPNDVAEKFKLLESRSKRQPGMENTDTYIIPRQLRADRPDYPSQAKPLPK